MQRIEKIKESFSLDLAEGFKALKSYLEKEKPQLQNSYYQFHGRYNAMEINQLSGYVNDQDASVARNRLCRDIFEFLDRANEPVVQQPQGLGLLPDMQEDAHPVKYYAWTEQDPIFAEPFASQHATSAFPSYQEALWSGKVDNGLYCLSNWQDSNAVRYHYFRLGERDMARFPVSVELKVEAPFNHPKPAAGLLLGFDRSSSRYLSFFFNNNGEYHLWEKGPQGYNSLAAGRSSLIKRFAFNKLGAIRDGDFLYLFINNQQRPVLLVFLRHFGCTFCREA
ncbi:MAG: hypothetical protein AAFO94_08175, partial [Bacteroidota bacterium]